MSYRETEHLRVLIAHIPVKPEPGSEVVIFSPAEELRKTEAVMMKDLKAMQGR